MFEFLKNADPEVYEIIKDETFRQEDNLEMIASENFVSLPVMEAMASPLANKYAEGYPGKRYYGGCEVVDRAEMLAQDRAKQIFECDHVNVQPHSGAQANGAALLAMLEPGQKLLGMRLDHGGHLTHGMKLNFSGQYYQSSFYGVNKDYLLDMDEVRKVALKEKPQLVIAGWSAYSRQLDFGAFRDICDEVGAYLLVDMSHFAGLVAAGLHPNPVPYADVVTTTIHKTLSGPRSGMILCKKEWAAPIDKALFPGLQGGPLMHTISAKAVALGEALKPGFKDKQKQTINNTQALAKNMQDFLAPLTGGSDTHLLLFDLSSLNLTGKQGEEKLDQIGITVNRNTVPWEERSPLDPSGIRVGTPALTTRGMKEKEMEVIAELFREGLKDNSAEKVNELKEKSQNLAASFPLYPHLF